MTATSLDAVLDRFDTALAARPIQYHPLMEAFRSLKIPNGVTMRSCHGCSPFAATCSTAMRTRWIAI